MEIVEKNLYQLIVIFVVLILIVIFLLLKRKMSIKTLSIFGISLQINEKKIDTENEFKYIRECILTGDNISMRIALQKCKEILKEKPFDEEALRYKIILENSIIKLAKFEVKIDSYIHNISLKLSALCWLIFLVQDILSHKTNLLLRDLLLYPVFIFGAWIINTIAHEYGHFTAVRMVLKKELGIVISKLSVFNFINFNKVLTFFGIIKLLFLLEANDTTIDIDNMVDKILEEVNKRETKSTDN
jgi:hypothetical protein